MSKSSSQQYRDDDDDDDAEYGKPSKSKHEKHKKHKEKEKKVNYAEPADLSFYPPVPQRPEILDQPPLPPPSQWVKEWDPVDERKAKTIISKLQGMREAFFFLAPVDPIGLPT